MKRKFVSLLIAVTTIVAILSASTKSQAQLIVTADSTISITQNGGVAKLRIQNLTVSAFYCTFLGPTGNVNFSHTAFTSIGPVVDTVIYIQLITPELPTLTPNTGYDWQGKVLGSASGYSLVKTFVTEACTFSPSPTITPSGTLSVCAGLTLTASPSGATYQWKYNSANILGATAETYSVTSSGIYTCDVTIGGCTMTTTGTTVNVVGSIGLHLGFSDTTVCDSSTIELLTSVDNPDNVSYSWSPAIGLDNPFSSSPMAFVTSPITYELTVDNGSCIETAAVTAIPVGKPHTNYAEITTSGFVLNGSYPGTISSALVAGHILSPKPGYSTTTYAVFDYNEPEPLVANDLIIIKTVSSECSETWHFLFAKVAEENQNVIVIVKNEEIIFYDITGRRVAIINSFEDISKNETYKVEKLSDDLPAGIYFWRSNGGVTKKFMR